VKIRDEGLVSNKAIHVALGVRADGTKEVLGLWLRDGVPPPPITRLLTIDS
jgi:putative transposase